MLLGNADLIEEWALRILRRFSPALAFSALRPPLLASFRSRAALQIENLALRRQLGVLHRSMKRPRLTAADRMAKDSPEPRAVWPLDMGRIVVVPQVGGLPQRYQRRAA